MSPHPLLTRIPPGEDFTFVRHVANVGSRLPVETARRYWKGRKTFLAKVLEGAGRSPEQIAADLESFKGAVRLEADRLRALEYRQRACHAGGAVEVPPEPDARQRATSSAGGVTGGRAA